MSYNEYVNIAKEEGDNSSIDDLFEEKKMSDRKRKSIMNSFHNDYMRLKNAEMEAKKKLADKLGYGGEEDSIGKAMKAYDNFRRSE